MFKIIGLRLDIILYTSLFLTFPTPPHSHPPSYLHTLLSILFKRKTLFSLYTTFIDYIYTDIDISKVKRKLKKIGIWKLGSESDIEF